MRTRGRGGRRKTKGSFLRFLFKKNFCCRQSITSNNFFLRANQFFPFFCCCYGCKKMAKKGGCVFTHIQFSMMEKEERRKKAPNVSRACVTDRPGGWRRHHIDGMLCEDGHSRTSSVHLLLHRSVHSNIRFSHLM